MAQAMIEKRKLDELQKDRGKKRPTPDDSDLEDNNDLEQQQQVVPSLNVAPTRKEKTQKQQYPLDSNGLSVGHLYLTKKSLSLLLPETPLATFAKTIKQDKNLLPVVHKRCDTEPNVSVGLSVPTYGPSRPIYPHLGKSGHKSLNYA